MSNVPYPHNAITTLPLMRFRGVTAPPYTEAPMNGSHTQAQRDYPYIDGAGHDNVRRDPMKFSFQLQFINGLSKTSSTRLFPELFIDWQNAFIFNGAEGTLVHPIFGDVLVRPTTWSVELSANRTSGVIMSVEFIETLHDPATLQKIEGADIGIRELAQKADEAIENADINYPTGERTDSLLDLARQIDSFAFSAKLSIQGIQNQAFGIVNGLIDSVNAVQDHTEWATHDALLDFWSALGDLNERALSSVRPTANKIVDHETTIDAFAETVGNTAGEIITLNTELLGAPTIAAGTNVTYFEST